MSMEEFKFLKSKVFLFNKKKPAAPAYDSTDVCNRDVPAVDKAVNQWKLRLGNTLGSTVRFRHDNTPRRRNFRDLRVFSSVAISQGLWHFKNSSKAFQLHNLGRRFYSNSARELQKYVHSGQVVKVLNRSTSSSVWVWIRSHKLMCFGILCAFTFSSLQRIPLSGRIHLAMSTDKIENLMGTSHWEEEARDKSDLILGAKNPMTIRVVRILREVLQATHQSLGLNNDFQVSVYEPREEELQMPERFPKKVRNLFSSLPNKRVQEKPLKVRKLGIKYGTQHLEGLNWEVIVVDDYIDNAEHFPNGKIRFHTGWLRKRDFTDADVATVLAHEVGHGLARHGSEDMLRSFVLAVLGLLIICLDCEADKRALITAFNTIADIIQAFISRRREMEADRIGMMLMAAAGYDPRHAPEFCEKYLDADSDYRSTHPSGKERAEKLRKVEVMRKAEEIYNKVRAGEPYKALSQ